MSIRSLLGLDRRPKVLSDKTIVEIRPMTVEQSVLIEQHFEKMADTFVETDFAGLEVQAAFFAKHAHEYASIIAAAWARVGRSLSGSDRAWRKTISPSSVQISKWPSQTR